MAYRRAYLSAFPFGKNTNRVFHPGSVPSKGCGRRRKARAWGKFPGNTLQGRLSCTHRPAKRLFPDVKYSPEILSGPFSGALHVSLRTPRQRNFSRVFIVTKAEKNGLAQFVVLCQFLISNLRNKSRR